MSVRVLRWADRAGLDVSPDVAPEAGTLALTRPDDVLALVRDDTIVATAGLWWREPVVLMESDGPAGRIGLVNWSDARDGAALLTACLERLRGEGCALALGPLDGSTWFGYRVVTDPNPSGADAEPAFALEPWPPPIMAQAFGEAGFTPVAHYLSSRVDALPDESARLDADLGLLDAAGVTLRSIDTAAPDDLRALHPLLLRAFADNPYYAPLDLARFEALYVPLLARIDPDLVLIAERARRPVGVVLAFSDAAQAARGVAVDTVIVKTLAVDPEVRGEGLGGTLVRAVQEAARAKGYRRAIHALMHADNASTRISAHLGRPIRRYALLGRTL